MICNRCNGPTKQKRITKKDGTSAICYECTSGCMTGKWPYTIWEKSEKLPALPPGLQMPQKIDLQDQILKCLLRIEKILANPKQSHVAEADMRPDEEVPF